MIYSGRVCGRLQRQREAGSVCGRCHGVNLLSLTTCMSSIVYDNVKNNTK